MCGKRITAGSRSAWATERPYFVCFDEKKEKVEPRQRAVESKIVGTGQRQAGLGYLAELRRPPPRNKTELG